MTGLQDLMIIESSTDLLQLISFAMGLVLLMVSLFPKIRTHALKMSAILFVIFLSLIINQWLIYFIAVFILATAITRLDFLQNLAAIARGGKKLQLTNLQSIEELEQNVIGKESIQYFDELSSLSPDEINDSSKGDLKDKFNREYYYQNIDRELVGMSSGRSGISKLEMTLIAQDLALSHVSRRNRMPVHRYVKIQDYNRVIELDGIIRYPDHDILLETFVYWVDWLSSFIIRKHIEQRIEKIRRYKEKENRDIMFRILIIGNFNADFQLSFEKPKNRLRKKYTDVGLSIEVLTFDDIALKVP